MKSLKEMRLILKGLNGGRAEMSFQALPIALALLTFFLPNSAARIPKKEIKKGVCTCKRPFY